MALVCIRFHYLPPQEKQRGSLRVCTQEAPWILLTPAKLFNIGIAVALKIPLTLDVLQRLIPPMMTDVRGLLFSPRLLYPAVVCADCTFFFPSQLMNVAIQLGFKSKNKTICWRPSLFKRKFLGSKHQHLSLSLSSRRLGHKCWAAHSARTQCSTVVLWVMRKNKMVLVSIIPVGSLMLCDFAMCSAIVIRHESC